MKELVKRHGLEGKVQNLPIAGFDEPEEETDRTAADVRAAQQIAGELQWVSTKTRPDISYAVSRVGSATVRSPKWAVEAGKGILKYLSTTDARGLDFKAARIPWRGDGTMEREIEVFTDASFAPGGGVSHGCEVFMWGGCAILWSSTKQPFPALSTAEAELIAMLEGVVMGESVGCIFEEILGKQHRLLYCDNTAAISLATQKGGNWRTRHLKVRAAHLRWKTEQNHWKVEHRPGQVMVADIGTKPLRPARLVELIPMLGLGCMSDEAEHYMRHGYGEMAPEEPTETDEPDPGMWEPTEWQDRQETPQTDEEMARVRSLSFQADMEKVTILVKLIAIFQSVEGVSAKLAEESEEASYDHVILYGVFMAALGAAVYHLIRRWWERRGGDPGDRPSSTTAATTGSSSRRLTDASTTMEVPEEPVVTETPPRVASLRGPDAATVGPGGAVPPLPVIGRPTSGGFQEVRRFIEGRGQNIVSYVEDETGMRWREVYTYVDDEMSLVHDETAGPGLDSVEFAVAGRRSRRAGGNGSGRPGGHDRGAVPGGAGPGRLGGQDLGAGAGAHGGHDRSGATTSTRGTPEPPVSTELRQRVPRNRAASAGGQIRGPIITAFGSRFHEDSACPTLYRSQKVRKDVCSECGIRVPVGDGRRHGPGHD